MGNAAADGRDLVFVSYSRADARWVQRFKVLLKPLVRSRRLRLWADTDIRVGDEWHPEINRAIKRSSVALLVVSADFLNSDFIMEQELPMLIAQGVRRASVLVGECLWDQVPELASVQWLHDPRREGALNLAAGQPGQRDRRLREICEQLIALIPERRDDLVAATPAVMDTPPAVATVHAGAGRAGLSGVPTLPPGYLAREELNAVIDAVAADEGGAVGLTGAVPAMGLHGQGGIGKSVLAAAIARDERIGRWFSDGVYWVTVGEKADLLAVQLELLGRLGAPGRAPRSPAEALRDLRDVLAKRRVLLVVDDVWSDAAAQAFRATGPYGRILYTSRDPQVFAAVGARGFQVDVLSSATARALASGILAVPSCALPAAADEAFAQVGHVALAVALLAAAVRGGRSWEEVTGVLLRDAGILGHHPYANTFKAMQIAVAGLPTELANALSSLAVFPPDTGIPVAAISRYWAHGRGVTAGQSARDLDVLAAANVLRLDEAVVGFHDLQHDYLLLYAPTLALLHAGLLDAYRPLLPADHRDRWWRLPKEEPYIWNHLVEHLLGAGERGVLAATVTDPAYLVQRIAAGGPHAAEADLGRAATALPTHDLIRWWRGWIARHAHVLTPGEEIDDNERAAAVTPTMLAWLAVDRSLPEDVESGRLTPLLPDPYLQVRWGLAAPDTALVRVLTGHAGGVRAVAWSPDGTQLASAGDDRKVRVWDPATGQQLAALTGHTGWVRAVAWSPDGARLASAGDDEDVRVWDPASGQQLATLTGHTSEVRAVAWSPDGTQLASAGYDGQLRVWDPATRQLLSSLTGHTGWVRAVTWSPDGTRLASAGYDGQLRVWDPATRQQLSSLTGHTGWVRAVTWSPDGTRLASAGYDGQLRVWDAATGQQLVTLTGHTSLVHAVAWSPDGTQLASAGDDEEVRVWDPATRQQLSTLTGRTSEVRAVAWSPDGTQLASAGDDEEVRVWDPATGQLLVTLTGHTSLVQAVAWSPDGTRLASAGDDRKVRVWDSATGKQLSTLTGHTGEVRAVAWSPDGTQLASAGDDRKVRMWDPATGKQLSTLTGHTGEVRAVAWSPDGTQLATASNEGKLCISGLDCPDHIIYLRVEPLTCLQWARTGIAAGGPNGVVVLDLASNRPQTHC